MTKIIRRPPAVLTCCHVVSYAILDGTVGFIGRTGLYVGRPGRMKEVLRVPCLAIGKPLGSKAGDQPLLMYCDREWGVIGVSSHDSVKDAKRRAERSFPGLAHKWKSSGYRRAQAMTYLRRLFREEECSFCGRLPTDVESMIGHSGRARICDICIRECYEILAEK
jgi:hypothetical protein